MERGRIHSTPLSAISTLYIRSLHQWLLSVSTRESSIDVFRADWPGPFKKHSLSGGNAL